MIRQIGAFPYRIAADGRAEVMLITSRDTGRWVMPKGNPIVGMSPHEAAAEEAWEEAGLTGHVCAAPLGEYRYLKRRRRRGEEEATVALYPLAVTAQAADWPEKGQRATRWFALGEAAAAVTEPQLKALIAGFRIPSAPLTIAERVLPAVQGDVVRRNMAGRHGRQFRMLGWFQSLMPKQGKFFEQFEAHAATLVAGADALAKLFHGDGPVETQIAAIVKYEHDADDITREVLQTVRRSFLTPFDRSAITDLINTMDDAIDEMQQTANASDLYEVTEFEPEMIDMTAIIVDAARLTAEAIPLLRKIGDNGHRLHELTERLVRMEGHADEIHAAGLKRLFKADLKEPMHFFVRQEMFKRLERVVDRFEDLANEIDGLVIDHS